MSIHNHGPYQQAFYSPVPTPLVTYLRTSFLWQLLRFVVLNARIIRVLARSG